MPKTFTASGDEGAQAAPSAKWVLAVMLGVIGMVNSADRTSITAVFPLLKADLGFTNLGLSALGTFFLWSYALASPLAGYLGDRLDRSRLIVWGLVGWSLVTAASGLMHARWELLTMRVLLGLVESIFIPAALALIAQYHPTKTVGTAMGILGVGQGIGLVGGATVVGYLADHFGWRSSLLALGVAGLAIALPAYLLLPKSSPALRAANEEPAASGPDSGPSIVQASLQLLRIPSYLVLAASGALTSIGVWIFLNWLPLYFKEAFSMSLASAGFFGASFTNGSATISQMLGGILSDRAARNGEKNRVLLQGVLILAAAPTLLVFAWTKSLTIIVVALALNEGLRTAADINMQPVLCDLAGKDNYAIAFGITNMVNCLSGGLGILVAGLLKATMGLAGVFSGVVGILVFDALMLFGCYRGFLKRDLDNAALRRAAAAVTPA